jgi:hypothetical protein
MIPNVIQTDRFPAGYIEVYGRKSSADLICIMGGDATVTAINCITQAHATGQRGCHLVAA